MDYDGKSEFDMSFSTFGRINHALWSANIAQKEQNIHSWIESCKILYKELYPYLKETKKENQISKQTELFKQVFDEYRSYCQLEQNHNNSPHRHKIPFQPPRTMFDVLLLWELELRKDMAKAGILLRQGEEPGNAII